MRLPRVHVDLHLSPGTRLTLPEPQARHLTQVLRLPVNAELLAFNGDGFDYQARLVRADRQGALLEIGPAGDAETPLPLLIHLALGVSKGERMDYSIQKSVELGVSAITPLFTERSMVQLAGERLARRQGHWQGVLIGACEQSGRRRVPTLELALALGDWLAQAPSGGLLLDPEGELALAALPRPAGTLTLLVGPEGGLSPRERGEVRARGLIGVRLGPRILRTETAPLAAIAVAQALWGDLAG